MPPRRQEGKQQVVQEDDKEKDKEMTFQDAKRALKAVYGHSDSDSDTNECCKQLHVLYGVSWDITSRRVVKKMRWVLAEALPAPREAPHHKWMETSIGFDASDCPKNMAGARQLPLVVTPIITNVRLYHILIGGKTALNLISLAAF
jgi:hypothetical protein